MSQKPDQSSPLFTHIDVSTHTPPDQQKVNLSQVLLQMVAAQDRQNELLEELLEQMSAAQRQRSAELAQWKQANPRTAKRCRDASEILGKVQSTFLDAVTEEIIDSSEHLMDGEFVLNEFVDRFGPRMAHLNGVLQVLSQLSANGSE